ncbi:MAG: TolC family protein [Flavobacteriales bacterium]|nr:TolC family protein [Flavobacteriales bacterium]
MNSTTSSGPLLVILTTLLSPSLFAQQPLDGYIAEGLTNNLVVQQRTIALEQAMLGLKDARSLFLPSANLNSSYLSGEGGRYFDFPVGDLVNPAYSTLNQLIGSEVFPQVENVKGYLNPNNYYDAHVRTSMPVLNTDLIHNKRIQQQQVQLKDYEVDIYKRQLVKEIKQAYYQVLLADAGIRTYESALELLQRNLAVSESLERNGKGVPAQVLRSRSELERIRTQLVTAKAQGANARRYFNFLLNKPMDSAVDTQYDVRAALADTTRYTEVDISRREELAALRTGVDLRNSQFKLADQYWVPKLGTFIDLGYQGIDWSTDSNADYYLFGVTLDVPVFNGLRNRNQRQRALLGVRSAELEEMQVTNQLRLGADVARNDLDASLSALQSATAQEASARSYFNLIETGYRAGVNTLIEYIDGRNQLTSSEVQLFVAYYTTLQRLAELERATATYPLSN